MPRRGELAHVGAVNADWIFPKSAEVKFPTLAGMVINRWFDGRLRFSAAGRDAS
jgi:hypothetical protein